MIIGITGTIGSGKSTVCQYLREQYYTVLDADAISRQLMQVHEKGYVQVVSAFGEGILLPNQEINRPALAHLIFHDQTAKKQLEAILHPLIYDQLHKQTRTMKEKRGDDSLIFWEIPLLFETNFHSECDVTVVVVAREEDIIRRVMTRSQLTEDEVLVRLRAQMPRIEKEVLANHVLVNEGTLEELWKQVDELIHKLKNMQSTGIADMI